MDRSRQMPNNNEQQSSSDDLIAELARLMAEEAQGSKPAAASPTPAEDKDADSATVVRIPSARPAAQADPAPAVGSAWGRSEDTPAPANNDAPEPPSTSSEPAFANPFTPASDPAPETSSAVAAGPGREATPEAPAFGASESASRVGSENASTFSRAETGQKSAETAPEPEAQPAAAADDPIAELIAQQEREEARKSQYSAMPRHVFPDPTPATRPAPAASAAGEPTPAPEAAEPAPAPVSTPVKPTSAGQPGAPVDPDVLSLLRSMSAESTARQAAKPRTGTDDAFSTPIFGAETAKPQRPAAAADPLEEIESLIGDAVRLSRDDQPQAAKAEMPVEPQVDLDDAAHRAEAAIAAATAASGRASHRPPQPELHDPLMDSDGELTGAAPELDRDEVKPAKPRSGRLVIGAAAATILVAVGLGLYWVFGETGITDGSVPFLASNTGDAKAPVEQNTTSSETSQPAIFSEIDGSNGEAPDDEQIVSRDQSTDIADAATAGADSAGVANTIASAPAATTTDVASAGNTASNVAGTDDASTGIRQVETPEAAEESLANRKVRTVTVRPDGTIVSNEDTLAANEVLPVVRPDVPALSDSAPVTDFQVAATPDATATVAATAPAAVDAVPAAPVATDVVDPLASLVSSSVAESDAAAGVDTATADAELVTDAPYPAASPSAAFRVASAAAGTQVRTAAPAATTPTNTIDLIAGAANQVASQLPTATETVPASTPQATVATTAPAATAPVATGPAGPDAPAYVQLSSQRSLDAANVTLAALSERFRGLFNGAEPMVRQVDLGERGIYYRVLVPANSLADASGVCSSVKSAGGDCFVRNNN